MIIKNNLKYFDWQNIILCESLERRIRFVMGLEESWGVWPSALTGIYEDIAWDFTTGITL